MRYLLLVLVSVVLNGCLHVEPKPDILQPPDPSISAPVIDARLLEPCGKPSTLAAPVSMESILVAHSEDVAAITDCDIKHKGLVQVIRKAFNR